jgi:hypothetical protein
MDWLGSQLELLQGFFFRPHPVAVAAVVACGLFWARVGPRLTPGRPGVWFGLVVGAAAYAPTQVWVRGEPTRAVHSILAENVGADRLVQIQPWSGIADALIAGYADEFVKFLLMLLVVFAMGYPRDPRPSTTAAIAPAAGFALFGANNALTPVFEAGTVDPSLAFPIVQQVAWVGVQFGAAYLLAKGWLTGRLTTYVLYAGLLHAGAAYTATLEAIGWHPVIVTLILAALALTTFTGGAAAIPARR